MSHSKTACQDGMAYTTLSVEWKVLMLFGQHTYAGPSL